MQCLDNGGLVDGAIVMSTGTYSTIARKTCSTYLVYYIRSNYSDKVGKVRKAHAEHREISREKSSQFFLKRLLCMHFLESVAFGKK